MNLTCVSKGKFANLTANKNYEGIEDGELFVVVNDIGARARYAKKYFRVDADAIVTAAVPPRAPRAARPANVNLLDILQVSADYDEDGDIEVTVTFNGYDVSMDIDLNTRISIISCGIGEIAGINGIGGRLQRSIAALPALVVNRDIDAVCNSVIDVILSEMNDDNSRALYILSDVVSQDCPFQRALTTRADFHHTMVNPNTDHTIIMWGISR